MNQHINQCLHNEDFLDKIVNSFPDCYFDWKTTASFYCAVHVMRGLAILEDQNLGHSHKDVFDYILEKTKSEKSREFVAFKRMYNNSRATRYDGLTDRKTMEKLWADKHNENIQRLGILKSYASKFGVSFELVEVR